MEIKRLIGGGVGSLEQTSQLRLLKALFIVSRPKIEILVSTKVEKLKRRAKSIKKEF